MRVMNYLAICALAASAAPAAAQDVAVTYLTRAVARPPVLSNLDLPPEDLGIAGAELGVADNNSSGRFLGQTYSLDHVTVAEDASFDPATLAGRALIIADAPPADLIALADALPEALIFNAAAQSDELRGAACRANLIHTTPSTSMLTDALAQFLASRRWDEIAMITGPAEADQALAESHRASLKKFGLKTGAENGWAFDADLRRSAASELPLFTQELGDYDVLIVADDAQDFARYVAYNTWLPRPVAGSAGLEARGWAPVVEQWGAAQLQGRFSEPAGRDMEPEDFAAWAAARIIGEAVTRTKESSAAAIRDYILSDDFELAAFLGRPLSIRPWNGQLRQPIPVVTREALVAQAPLEGFLHQVNELDTLGADRTESACASFGG